MKIRNILLSTLCVPSMAILPAISSCTNIESPKDFSTDSWETVIDVCNKGYIAFANAYIDQYKTYSSEEEAIIDIQNWIFTNAQTHQTVTRNVQIKINGFVFYCMVRLIDVNHDDLADGSGKAKFTFEFVDTICQHPFDFESEQGYCTPDNVSSLYTFLNEFLITALPKIIQDNIKIVKKPCAWRHKNTDESEIVYNNDRFFCLSFAEINKKGHTIFVDEGEPYLYYTANYYGVDYVESKKYFGQPTSWFLRSPENDDMFGGKRVGEIAVDGNLLGTRSKYGSGIAPAFCI